jgi:Ca2+-binding RTX toxin-like protein
VIGTATAGASGAWTLNTQLPTSGVQSITLKATDAAGNAGASAGTSFYDQVGGVHFTGYGGDNVEIGANHDTLTGGGGHDSFVFNAKFGVETVSDFDPANDKIVFDHTLFASASAVLQHSAQVGADTVITYDGSDKVTLHNVTLSSLHTSNFVFI